MTPRKAKRVVHVVIHRFGDDQLRLCGMFETFAHARAYVDHIVMADGKALEWYEKDKSGWDDTWDIVPYTLGDLWHLPQSKD
jgi:hypothetical protein